MSTLHYHTIETLGDPHFELYLDRFQEDFPANEQISVSSFLRMVKKKEQGLSSSQTLLGALEGEDGPLIGMACYAIQVEQQAAILWYLSVAPEHRNQGVGSRFYQEIVRRIKSQYPEIRFLIYEVERPDQAHTPEVAELARRRIGFYRRNGGQTCMNVEYWQQVRREPRVMMYLMVDAFQPEDREPAAVFAAVRSTFGSSLAPEETLILE